MNYSEYLFQSISRALNKNRRDKQALEIYANGPALGSYKGKVRPENEDRVTIVTFPPTKERPALFLAALCDGLGGMQAGAECARDSLAYLISTMASSQWTNVQQFLRDSILSSNQLLNKKYVNKSGSTLSAVLFTASGEVSAYNVGDSRIYSYGPSGIKQISSDDTLEKFLKRSHDANDIHPQLGQRLAQSMGMASIQLEDLVLPSTDSQLGLFLSSDGAHDINHETLASLASAAVSPLEFVDHLLTLHSWSAARDNSSLVCLPLGEWLVALGKFWVADVIRLFTSYNEVFIQLPSPSQAITQASTELKEDAARLPLLKKKGDGDLFSDSSTFTPRKKPADAKKQGRKPARPGKKKKPFLKVIQ